MHFIFSKFSLFGAYLTEKTACPLQRPNCQYCLGTVWEGCSCSQRVKAGFTLICLTALSEAASRLPWRIQSGLSAQWSAGHWSLLVGTLHYLVRIGCRISVRYNFQKVLFAREHSGQICKLAGQWRMRFVPYDAEVSNLYVCLLYVFVLSCGSLRCYNKFGFSIHLWAYIFFSRNFCLFRSAKSQVRVFWLYHVYPSAACIQHLEKPHVWYSLKMMLPFLAHSSFVWSETPVRLLDNLHIFYNLRALTLVSLSVCFIRFYGLQHCFLI